MPVGAYAHAMVITTPAEPLVDRLRRRDPLVGYWIMLDSPYATEAVAAAGYDYVCLDLQHGLIGYPGLVANVMAVDAGGSTTVVRVGANDPALIGRALDAGARAVIVPLVSSAAEAAAAVAACRYQPRGIRSFGPTRAPLRGRTGADAAELDAAVACIVMIETAAGLADVAAICATPGVDGVYIGPSDLALGMGAPAPGAVDGLAFDEALADVRAAAEVAGIACGIHCGPGEEVAARLAEGFTFATVSSDLQHLAAAAATHLAAARRDH